MLWFWYIINTFRSSQRRHFIFSPSHCVSEVERTFDIIQFYPRSLQIRKLRLRVAKVMQLNSQTRLRTGLHAILGFGGLGWGVVRV